VHSRALAPSLDSLDTATFTWRRAKNGNGRGFVNGVDLSRYSKVRIRSQASQLRLSQLLEPQF
jgi:hypothetical protein